MAARASGVDTLAIFTAGHEKSKNFEDAKAWIDDFFTQHPDASIGKELAAKGYRYKAREEAIIA